MNLAQVRRRSDSRLLDGITAYTSTDRADTEGRTYTYTSTSAYTSGDAISTCHTKDSGYSEKGECPRSHLSVLFAYMKAQCGDHTIHLVTRMCHLLSVLLDNIYSAQRSVLLANILHGGHQAMQDANFLM